MGKVGKLALVYTLEVFLERTLRCQERNSDRDWGTTASNILFRSLGNTVPLPLIQESINVLRKCAVQSTVPVVENNSDGYPGNIQLFWVEFCRQNR